MAGLQAGNLQIVPEFSSSLLSYLAANGGTGSDATAIDEQMTALREQLPDTLTAFEPAAVDDGIVIACSAAAIDEFTLASISDLADADITLGGTSDFADATSGGLAALNTAYETELTVTAVDDVAAAVVDGTVDCGALPAMSTAIVLEGLIVLEDDKAFAPANALVPIMTVEAGQADVQAVVDAIDASLTTDVVRSLLVKAETGDQSYDIIAKQFLASIAAEQ
jgi:glycine betaine/choline ABC-type transport system substrate-binding protein